MGEFFEMGGHGVYIWPCYGLAIVLLIGLLGSSWKQLSNSKRDLAKMEMLAQNEGETS
jgi:heme exporter protein CcmD